jgi:hypothetical protein
MSDTMRLNSDTSDLSARLRHERDLADFRDDNGHLIIVPGRDGLLVVRPHTYLERIVRDVRDRKN